MNRPLSLATQIVQVGITYTYVRVTLRTVSALSDPVAFATSTPTSAAVLADAGLAHNLYTYDAVLEDQNVQGGFFSYTFMVRFANRPDPPPPYGPTGARGVTGAAGPQGQTGAVGATGPVGATGAAGATGPQGVTGLVGPPGPQGLTGIGVIVSRFLMGATAAQVGYVAVSVPGGVSVAVAAILTVNIAPLGIFVTAGTTGQLVDVQTSGLVLAGLTGLGSGVSMAVGVDATGRLVRASDPTCLPGFYVGDCDQDGNLTIQIRFTPVITDYALLVWTQPEWDIDPINGDDRNTGRVGQPIKTAAEQHRRVGPLHEINYDPTSTTPKVKMYIRSSLQSDDCLTIRVLVRPMNVTFAGNNQIPYRIEGSLGTPLASGTITNVRAFDNTTGNGTPWGIQTDLGSMAAHVALGRLVVRTNNNADPNFPQTWWMAKDEGTWQRTSYPTNVSASDLYNGVNSGTFTIGDTFSVYALPTIPRLVFESENVNIGVLFNRIRVSAGFVQGSGSPTFVESTFDNYYWTGKFSNVTNCQVGGIASFGPQSQPYFTFGLFLNTLKLFAGKPEFQNYTMFQGGSWLATDGGVRVHSHTRGIQVFDSTGDGWQVQPGDLLVFAGSMIGYGNAGYGLRVSRGARVIVGGLGATGGRFFRLTGSLGDFVVGGRTSGPALDTATYLWTPDRAYTWDLFNTSVPGGGFDKNVFDPNTPGTGIHLDT